MPPARPIFDQFCPDMGQASKDPYTVMVASLVWAVPSATWLGAVVAGFFDHGKGGNLPGWLGDTIWLGILSSVVLSIYFANRVSSVRNKRLAAIIAFGCFFGVSTLAAPVLSFLLSVLLR